MFSLPATLPNLQLFFPRFLFPSRAPPPISTVFGEVKAAVFNGCPKLSELAKCEYEPEQSWCETTEVRCKQQSGESVTDGSLKSTFSPYFFLSLSLSFEKTPYESLALPLTPMHLPRLYPPQTPSIPVPMLSCLQWVSPVTRFND